MINSKAITRTGAGTAAAAGGTTKPRWSTERIVRWVLLLVWGLFAGFPAYWMAITAFKVQRQIYQGPFVLPWVDFQPSGAAWGRIFGQDRDAVFGGIGNSLLFATVSALLAVLLGAFAAYGLARYNYKYGPYRNNDLGFLIVSQRIMPPIVAVIALFTMFRLVGLHDTQLGMIIAYTWFNLPLTVFILTDFMNRIPIDIEQAAAIDGYGKFTQIWRIVLPLIMPGMAAAYLLSFFFAWNDFLLALMLTFRKASTLPIVIANMSTANQPLWWLISAVGLLAIIPPMIAVVVLDRFMERQVLFGGTR